MRTPSLEQAHLFMHEADTAGAGRMYVAEACAAAAGGWSVREYWGSAGLDCGVSPSLLWDAEERGKTLANMLHAESLLTPTAIAELCEPDLDMAERKLHGVFHTDRRLAAAVAEACATRIQPRCRLADMAAGTGMLIAAVAELFFHQFPSRYSRWIADNVFAADLSSQSLRGLAAALGVLADSGQAVIEMKKHFLCCDSMTTPMDTIQGSMDIVVGNPPWSRLRPSVHKWLAGEGVSYQYGADITPSTDISGYDSYRERQLSYNAEVAAKWAPGGQPNLDAFAVFLELYQYLLADGGQLSCIVPGALIRSKGLEDVRRRLLGSSSETDIRLLDNRKRYFDIDTRFRFLILSAKKNISAKDAERRVYFRMRTQMNDPLKPCEPIVFDVRRLASIRQDLSIPECRNEEEMELFERICSNGTEWKEKWNAHVLRELDMTNARPNFTRIPEDGMLPVVEGRMVQQHRFGAKAYVSGTGRGARWKPSCGRIVPQFYIHQDALPEHVRKRTEQERVGFCDIAGQTNERAMMCAIIPKNVVCGNKVPTIVFNGEDATERALLWTGVANSFVFDWLLRRVISTTVNFFILFGLPMPDIDLSHPAARRIIDNTRSLSIMDERFYTSKRSSIMRAEIDVCTAHAFGVSCAEFRLIMRDFPLLDRGQPTLPGETTSTITTDLILGMIAEGEEAKFHASRFKAATALGAYPYVPKEMSVMLEEARHERH